MYKEYKEAWAELISVGADFEIEKIDVRGAPINTYKNALPTHLSTCGNKQGSSAIEITWYIKTNESRIPMHIKSWTQWLPGSFKIKSLMATESL